MARTRSRSFLLCPKGSSERRGHNSDTGQTWTDLKIVSNDRYNLRRETITDEVNVKRDRLAQAKLQRAINVAKRQPDADIAKSVIADLYASQMQVHPCTHVKQEIHEFPGVSWSTSIVGTPYTYVRNYHHHDAFRQLVLGSMTGPDALLDAWAGQNRNYVADGFHGHDWFALLTKWHETCDNLIPSTSLIGESMIEHGIFVDAFKLIINPSSVLKRFLKFATTFKKKKTTLGKFKRMVSTAADAHLYTTFGVLPAIDEIKTVFEAHQKVSSRLKFLKENKGGYIPIRVRQSLPSSIDNGAVGEESVGIICESKWSDGVISAQGKVRPDLDYAGAWKAYLQYFGLHKVIGLAWELVPFSFVIDWVTNAGEYIQKYTAPNFASPFYNVRHISHSVKQSLIEGFQIPKNKVFQPGGDRLFESKPPIISRLTTTNYTRYPGLPETSGRVDFSQLGTFHALIAGSLLIQRRKW